MRSRILPPLAAFLLLCASVLPAATAHAQTTPVYIALGDSLAFGVGADTPETQGYVGLTAAALRADMFPNGLDVSNLSVPGATSADLLVANGQVERALAQIGARGGTDIISLDIGANDLLALAGASSPCLDSPSSQGCVDALGQTLTTLQTNLTATLHQLRTAAPNAKIYVMDLYNPYSGTGDTRELIASVGVQQVNGVITASARDPSVRVNFVSIHDVFEGRAKQWIAEDGIHPNNDGYRVMAEVLTASIEDRDPVLPSDLVAPPSVTATPAPKTDDNSGVSKLVPAIGIPLAFLAGGVLSAAYFMVRGRR
ncbi:MAG: GDSL-type esterase/lipase family protein [Chloroflexota bacterium]